MNKLSSGRRQFPSQPSQNQSTNHTIQYGHNGEKVVMQFSRPVKDLQFDEVQTQAAIDALTGCLKMLQEHKAK